MILLIYTCFFSHKAGNKKTNLVSPRTQLGYDEEIQNELVN